MNLRPYQQQLEDLIYYSWSMGYKNILGVMPTGAGKTVLVADIIKKHEGYACVIAHRHELVSQLSLALARLGVYHNIIASNSSVKFITSLHNSELGKSYYHPQSKITVASVDTLLKRDLRGFKNQVTLWVQDEAHHVIADNKWGRATDLFPNALGLGVTATPRRADGLGLGRHAHGVFDTLLEGPGMRDLINMGMLTDYRVVAPKSNIKLEDIKISEATGDYNQTQLRNASHNSTIVGDVVDNYIKFAYGKLAVCFAVDVQTCTEIANKFTAWGIPAAAVSAKTPDHIRNDLIQKFKRREILVLINVDLFGEGFDLPAIEVVIMARPTKSFALFAQQIGRALRLMPGKDYGLIIDHVGNFEFFAMTHGLPDGPQVWTLDAVQRSAKTSGEGMIPMTTCDNCMSSYLRFNSCCPYCGCKPRVVDRTKIEYVDGDLEELSPEILAAIRGLVLEAQEDPQATRDRLTAGGLPQVAVNSQVKLQRERLQVLSILTDKINYWRACRAQLGEKRNDSYRRFYFQYGIDVVSAQALNKKDAEILLDKITKDCW